MLGQPKTETGNSPDENQVSSTSVSCVIFSDPQCAQAVGSTRATVILWQVAQCHAGIRCPHQSCREMHQSWMLRIHSKYVFPYCSGVNRMCPFSTAAIALSASG